MEDDAAQVLVQAELARLVRIVGKVMTVIQLREIQVEGVRRPPAASGAGPVGQYTV